ncbi:hypothetical protein [Halarcobacter anaerophilus]|uniref:Uncharacterized protein n=1 Tax=Halarcobacter anaerophilus TaxID=877500 RepID=A0A4Q0XX14_9BACT|nr:hypothetical protein [Halarcobacter anaerophilus]QDF30305.1 putative membrane protein [Halarcobacter anaerophilus]RXJ61204.1 hypothetical protein CRV06_14410 [Halarcobacter anaerophilus]
MNEKIKYTLALTFKEKINIDGYFYTLPIVTKLLKTIVNVLFVMGGFLSLGAIISILTQKFDFTIPFWLLILFLLLILLSVNFFITYISR